MKRLWTAALGGLLMSCQGPAAVLAREPAPGVMAPAIAEAGPRAAITAAHRERALVEALRLAGA